MLNEMLFFALFLFFAFKKFFKDVFTDTNGVKIRLDMCSSNGANMSLDNNWSRHSVF